MLTRDQIKNCDDLRIEVVKVPEWNDEVFVKTITAGQKAELEASVTIEKKGKRGKTEYEVDTKSLKVRAVIMTVCDENKNNIFNMDEDLQWLSAKSSSAIERIFDVANRLNNILGDQIEDAVKN